MLAEEAGDEVLELAFVARARGVRIGKWGGNDFTLAALTAESRPARFCTVRARKRNSTIFWQEAIEPMLRGSQARLGVAQISGRKGHKNRAENWAKEAVVFVIFSF